MKSEDEFRRHVIKVAEDMGGHVSHIESHQTSAGVPDLNMRLFGEDVWLELKVVRKDGAVKLRPPQKRWHRDRAASGGKSWVAVLLAETDSVLVIPGHVAQTLAPPIKLWTVRGHVFKAGAISDLLKSLAMEIQYDRVAAYYRDRTTEITGSPEAPLPESGPNVDGHHWLHDKP